MSLITELTRTDEENFTEDEDYMELVLLVIFPRRWMIIHRPQALSTVSFHFP